MEHWPSGLLVIGDALCNLDPIYGHGMTVAALEAEALARGLKEQQEHPRPDFERHMLTSFQEAIQPAWWIDAIADLRWSEVTYSGQEPPLAVKLIHRYQDLYLLLASKNAKELSRQEGPSSAPDLFSPQPNTALYALMIELMLSPQVVFNATTYHLLLEFEATQVGPRLLQELTEDYHLPLEEILNKVLPTFTLAFMRHPARAAIG